MKTPNYSPPWRTKKDQAGKEYFEILQHRAYFFQPEDLTSGFVTGKEADFLLDAIACEGVGLWCSKDLNDLYVVFEKKDLAIWQKVMKEMELSFQEVKVKPGSYDLTEIIIQNGDLLWIEIFE
jgi:hypothetical protein